MSRVKDGDIVASTGKGLVSGIINVGTGALPYPLPFAGISHVGVVCKLDIEPLVYESTTVDRPPCVIQEYEVRGVQAHKLDDYADFPTGQLWHYPLRRDLYEHEIERLRQELDMRLGLPYDMPGAIRSGGLFWRMLNSFRHGEDLASVFCSEMAADVLARVGVLRTPNVSSWNPNRLCRYLVRQGVCDEPRRLV